MKDNYLSASGALEIPKTMVHIFIYIPGSAQVHSAQLSYNLIIRQLNNLTLAQYLLKHETKTGLCCLITCTVCFPNFPHSN